MGKYNLQYMYTCILTRVLASLDRVVAQSVDDVVVDDGENEIYVGKQKDSERQV